MVGDGTSAGLIAMLVIPRSVGFMDWSFTNDHNKNGADRKHLVPISLRAGVNMWLSDYLGLGLQIDYPVMAYKRVLMCGKGVCA